MIWLWQNGSQEKLLVVKLWRDRITSTFTADAYQYFKMECTGGCWTLLVLSIPVNFGEWKSILPVIYVWWKIMVILRLRGTSVTEYSRKMKLSLLLSGLFSRDVKVECTGDIRTLLKLRWFLQRMLIQAMPVSAICFYKCNVLSFSPLNCQPRIWQIAAIIICSQNVLL